MTSENSSLPPQTTYTPPMTINVKRQGVNVAVRQGLALTGLGLILLSVPVGFATPALPLGLPMAVVGAVLIGRNAVWARQWLEKALAQHPHIEKRVPDRLMMPLFGRPKRVNPE